MSDRLPEGIQRQHIIWAIDALKNGVQHAFGPSTYYDLVFEDSHYPPKAVVGLAAGHLTGTPLGPYDFKGGLRSACFRILKANGFDIQPKGPSEPIATDPQQDKRSDSAISMRPEDQERGTGSNPDWTRDELILALDIYLRHRPNAPSKESAEIAGLSDDLIRLGGKLFPNELKSGTFRNRNGVYMKLMNLRRFDSDYTATGRTGLKGGSTIEEAVWNEFSADPSRCNAVAHAIRLGIVDLEVGSLASELGIDNDMQEASEGRLLTRKHVVRERNKTLVANKRRWAIKRYGRLACEVCDFDFSLVYGQRGAGFIECHHTKPVATLMEGHKSHIDDLALVCANCHRIIHRMRPWLTIAEAKSILIKPM